VSSTNALPCLNSPAVSIVLPLGERKTWLFSVRISVAHNAVDKVIGHTILSDVATTDKVLVISGRISSDIILKAVLAGLPLVVSPSAPTHLAVELARRLGITVVGFARGTRLSVYSEVWRLQRD
jgi:formate dehydrogenase accessory protein FdhD